MTTNDTKTKLIELGNSVCDLSTCFIVWYELTDGKKKDYRELSRNDHSDFFITTIESLFTSFCITTYRLYDEGKHVNSIKSH